VRSSIVWYITHNDYLFRNLLERAKRRASTKRATHEERRKLNKAFRDAANVHQKWLEQVQEFEEMEDITRRWTEKDEEWDRAVMLYETHRYRRALDDLSRLLIQRLFELEKMGIGGTGMWIIELCYA
jgi:hypothetical protein